MDEQGGRGRGEDLARLVSVLRRAMDETSTPLSPARSEEIFRGVMVKLEQQRRRWDRRLARRLQTRWQHLKNGVLTLFSPASHEA